MMDVEQLRPVAAKLANSLGVSFFIRDGSIHQHGPGERVDPPPSAQPGLSHGRFEISNVEVKE
jgi:hypothetical protein